MGEMDFEQKALVKAVDSALQEVEQAAADLRVATPGGRFHVRWDEGGSATALGQLAFFAEFLEVTKPGLFAIPRGEVVPRPDTGKMGPFP